MTVEFMVIASERSASTWAANWLTTDTTLCIHDPLRRYALHDLDFIHAPGKRLGVSCTALQMVPRWLNDHPAKKVILHRHGDDIRASLAKLGAPYGSAGSEQRLGQIDGLHYRYTDMFDQTLAMYMAGYLGVPFDYQRHAELVQMNIQPHWPAVKATPHGEAALADLIRKTLE